MLIHAIQRSFADPVASIALRRPVEFLIAMGIAPSGGLRGLQVDDGQHAQKEKVRGGGRIPNRARKGAQGRALELDRRAGIRQAAAVLGVG